MTDYVALGGIKAPGTAVYGYQRGDRVHEDVVNRWGLTVGLDVAEGLDVPPDELPAPVRPGEGATRAEWEKWAVANGMSEAEAAAVSQDKLEAIEAAPAPVAGESEQGEQPVRPADTAPKADWQAYAKALGADETWAYASSTTKADLQAYEPAPGDTIAVAATDLNQG